MRNLEVLNNSTDAQGRKLEVFKVHVPPPLFRKYSEAEGVHVSLCTHPRPYTASFCFVSGF